MTETDIYYFIQKAVHLTEDRSPSLSSVFKSKHYAHKDLVFHIVLPNLSSHVFITVKGVLIHLLFVRNTGIHENKRGIDSQNDFVL